LKVLAVLHKKEDDKSRSKYLSTLKSDFEILIKWDSTGKKQLVEASSLKIVDTKEEEVTGLRSRRQRR